MRRDILALTAALLAAPAAAQDASKYDACDAYICHLRGDPQLVVEKVERHSGVLAIHKGGRLENACVKTRLVFANDADGSEIVTTRPFSACEAAP